MEVRHVYLLDPELHHGLKTLLVVLVDQLEVLLRVLLAKDLLQLGQDETFLAGNLRRFLHWHFEHGITDLDLLLLLLLRLLLNWLFFLDLLLDGLDLCHFFLLG